MLKTDFSGRTAVVTAGAGAVGKEICKVFAANGAKVAVCDKDAAAAKKVAEELKAQGFAAEGYELNIRKFDTFEGVLEAVRKDLGPVAILVNNENEEIRPEDRKPLHEFDVDMYEDIVYADINGLFTFTKYAMQDMVKASKGVVVNVTSIRGLVPVANQTPVVAVSGAAVGLTRMWGVECKDAHIRVNAVAAGLSVNEKNADYLDTPEKIEKKLSHLAVRRLAEPADIANAALFLASDEASYITGAVLPVDGGLNAGYVRSF